MATHQGGLDQMLDKYCLYKSRSYRNYYSELTNIVMLWTHIVNVSKTICRNVCSGTISPRVIYSQIWRLGNPRGVSKY